MQEKCALLVIDMQFGPLWDTYKTEETLSVIQNLIKQAKEENLFIIYTQHEEPAGGFLTRGSQFWQFHQGISPSTEDVIIYKKATDSFHETELLEVLQKQNITHLVVTGARTEYCIDTTCRAAISKGFNVTLVADGHTTVDGQIPAQDIIKHHNFTLSNIATPDRQMNVLRSEQISFNQNTDIFK